jgi:hypothetical protein
MRRVSTPVCVASLASVLVVLAAFVPQSVAQVIINEVHYDPDGSDTGLEFVELLNCGREGVLLTGWVLETGNGAGANDWTVEWIGGELDYLESGAIFLIGEADVQPTPDYSAPLDLQNGPDGVRLRDLSGVADVVGWGEPLFQEYYEGAPAFDAPSGLSLSRSPDCFDNDNNAHDFVSSEPTPGVRNALTRDLSVEVRHSGATVFPSGGEVRIECLVRNVGALAAEGYEATVGMSVEGGSGTVCEERIETRLEPRDSTEVTLTWRNPAPGYHRARVELSYPADQSERNNTDDTTLAVGEVGHVVAINEIMHSPSDEGTEWVELLNVTGDTVDVSRWALGDGTDLHAVRADTAARYCIAPDGFALLARDVETLEWLTSCPVFGTDGWEALSADDTVLLADGYGTPMDVLTYERDWGGERGISLERVRPDMPAQDAGNWGGSVAPGGSTPGRENSIYLSVVPSQGRLTIAPNPFTPDGDGRDDRCVLRFELPVARATARISVFDLAGRVRALLVDHSALASEGELLWDGKGTDGELLPSGLYVVHMEAIDARAGVFVSAKSAVGIVR